MPFSLPPLDLKIPPNLGVPVPSATALDDPYSTNPPQELKAMIGVDDQAFVHTGPNEGRPRGKWPFVYVIVDNDTPLEMYVLPRMAQIVTNNSANGVILASMNPHLVNSDGTLRPVEEGMVINVPWSWVPMLSRNRYALARDPEWGDLPPAPNPAHPVLNPPGPGPSPTPSKEQESDNTPLIVAGGVGLLALVLYFGKKKR